MIFRVTYGGVLYDNMSSFEEARVHAMTEARELTRACGFPVVATVHMLGLAVLDDLGRDVTPVSLVGNALGRIENGHAVADWQLAIKLKSTKVEVAA